MSLVAADGMMGAAGLIITYLGTSRAEVIKSEKVKYGMFKCGLVLDTDFFVEPPSATGGRDR
jgi:hypothetical protein